MKPSSRPPRTPSRLSDSIHHQLNSYALVASAAGVSLLALPQPTQAKIVYTKAHHVIGLGEHYNLDLNHDGKTDFKLGYFYSRVTSGTIRSIYAAGASGNGVAGTAGSPFLAAAFKRGTPIPNRHRFSHAKARMAYECDGFIGSCAATTSFKGNWVNSSNRYLGLRFKIHGKTHYGWARLSIPFAHYKLTATLTGYAYETIPNKPIITGKTRGPDVATVQPATIGHLAIGASAIPAWRVKSTAATTH